MLFGLIGADMASSIQLHFFLELPSVPLQQLDLELNKYNRVIPLSKRLNASDFHPKRAAMDTCH